jgi:hypothetical protein
MRLYKFSLNFSGEFTNNDENIEDKEGETVVILHVIDNSEEAICIHQ